jgi:hypothetical protein
MAGEPVMSPFPIVRLINGSVIEFRSWEREQNLMGDPIAAAVVDEAGLLTPTAQSAISSRRSSTMGPIHYIGNPGMVAGPFRKLCGLAETGEWPGVYSLHRWTWEDKYKALLTEGPGKAEEYADFIKQERASLPEFEFRRLYDAEWTEDESAVFRNVHEVSTAAKFAGPNGDSYVIGLDVAQLQDYLVAVVVGVNGYCAGAMERMRGVSYPDAAQRMKRLQEQYHAPIVVETNGPGIAITQEFDRIGVNYIPFTTTGQTKQEAVLRLAADFQEKRIKLADLPPMQHELSVFRYERTSSMHYRYEAPAGEHDDCVMALAFASWGRLRCGNQRVEWVA